MHTLAMLIAATSLSGGEVPREGGPSVVPLVVATGGATLPVNSEVLVRINEPLDSSKARKGRRFDVSVARDVLVGGVVAIPQGTPGTGEVTWRTGKGAFGKSGKMEIAVTSLLLNGRVVPVSGKMRVDGKGGTGAAIGAIFAGGLVAGAFVTGRSASIEQGHEWRAFTTEALALGGVPVVAAAPVMVANYAPAVVAPAHVPPVVSVTEIRVAPVQAYAPPVVVPSPVPAYVPPVVRVAQVRVAPSYDYVAPRGHGSRAVTSDAYAARLAAAQGVRGYEPRQGWTISD